MKRASFYLVCIAAAISFAGAATGTPDWVNADRTEEGESDTYDSYVCEAPNTAVALVMDPFEAIPATCENGEFERTGQFMLHGFTKAAQGGHWTGLFESWLVHEGEDQGFKCHFSEGLIKCWSLGGEFPAQGARFEHVCYAFETDLELPISSHDWGCEVGGDIVPVD